MNFFLGHNYSDNEHDLQERWPDWKAGFLLKANPCFTRSTKATEISQLLNQRHSKRGSRVTHVTRVTRTAAGGYRPPHHFLGEAVFLHSKHVSAPPHLCSLRLLTLPPFYSLYYSDVHHLPVPSYYENKNESSCCSFKTWRVSTPKWEGSEGQSCRGSPAVLTFHVSVILATKGAES